MSTQNMAKKFKKEKIKNIKIKIKCVIFTICSV